MNEYPPQRNPLYIREVNPPNHPLYQHASSGVSGRYRARPNADEGFRLLLLASKALRSKAIKSSILSGRAEFQISNYFPKRYSGNTAMERPLSLVILPFKGVSI